MLEQGAPEKAVCLEELIDAPGEGKFRFALPYQRVSIERCNDGAGTINSRPVIVRRRVNMHETFIDSVVKEEAAGLGNRDDIVRASPEKP